MPFNSSAFYLVFLPIVFTGYYFLFHRWPTGQILFLTFASLVFYGFADPSLVAVLLVSLWVNGLCTYMLLRTIRARKVVFVIVLVFNVGLLVYFKYAYLFACTFLDPEQEAAILQSLKAISLPIGISFFTFRAITLVADVYRGKTEGMENLHSQCSPFKLQLYIWLYIVFSPQLLAGPIAKANEFMNQTMVVAHLPSVPSDV
jgi:alginate O-acetyltransferase complex protein AlgI